MHCVHNFQKDLSENILYYKNVPNMYSLGKVGIFAVVLLIFAAFTNVSYVPLASEVLSKKSRKCSPLFKSKICIFSPLANAAMKSRVDWESLNTSNDIGVDLNLNNEMAISVSVNFVDFISFNEEIFQIFKQ